MTLTKDNYFSREMQNKYMGFSQFKGFVPELGGCEAQAMAKLKGEWKQPTTAPMWLGKLGHAWNEGTLIEFLTANKDRFVKFTNNKCKTKEGQKDKTKTHKVARLTADACRIVRACGKLQRDNVVANLRKAKKEVMFTAGMFGVKWKVLVDVLGKDHFADLKFLREIYGKTWKDGRYIPTIEASGYYLQLAIYAEVIRIATKANRYLDPFLIISDKAEISDYEVFGFTETFGTADDFIQEQLQIVGNYIERVKAVKSGQEKPIRCEKCDYCKATKKLDMPKNYLELYNF